MKVYTSTLATPFGEVEQNEASSLNAIKRVARLRLKRKKAIMRDWKLSPKWALGMILGGQLLKNPSFREGLATMAGFAAMIGSVYWLKNASTYKSKIVIAHHKIARVLHQGATEHQGISSFLKQWKYIYVDKTGALVGTNWNIPLLPRHFRLETKKILEGNYQEKDNKK